MRRVPRVTQAMRKSIDTVRDSRGKPMRGGVLLVPPVATPEVWNRIAQASQTRLEAEVKA